LCAADSCSNTVLAITAIRPGIGTPNGFAARYAHFLRALANEFQLQIALLDRKVLSPLSDPPDLPDTCQVWDGGTQSSRLGIRGLAARLRQRAFLPSWASPIKGFDHLLAEQTVALAVGLHFRSADVLLSLPARIRKVAVLEEYEPILTGRSLWHTACERLEAQKEQHLFRRVGRNVDVVVAISDDEARRWHTRCPEARVEVIPHAVDCFHFIPQSATRHVDIGFFGMLTPGRDTGALQAARALRSDPRTASKRMAFIGAEPSSEIQAWSAEGALVTGRVPDMREWYARTGVVVAADDAGLGVKTTVLEAWAMARPVVATPAALRGVPARDGENVLVIPSASHVTEAVARLLDDETLASRLGRTGRATVISERNALTTRSDFVSLCRSVLEQQSCANGCATTSLPLRRTRSSF
jgi:glycosyltransferase involved in cell wall biosynthesis